MTISDDQTLLYGIVNHRIIRHSTTSAVWEKLSERKTITTAIATVLASPRLHTKHH